MMILSTNSHPGTKAVCDLSTRSSITTYSLAVKTLEIILYNTLQYELGLNPLMVEGFHTLGFRVKDVQLIG